MLIPDYAVFALIFFMFLLLIAVVVLIAQSIGNEKVIAEQKNEIGYLRGVLDTKEDFEYRISFRKYLQSISKGEKK